MALDEKAVAEIKRLHQENELTLEEIGALYGVAATTISRLARVNGWPTRCELIGRAPPSFRPVVARAQARLVRRFYDMMSMKVEQMEKDMADGKLSTEDFERAGKSMAAMLANLGKAVTAVPDGDKKQKPKAAAPAAASASDEAERLHREIVERFERIQRRRNAEAGSA